MTLRVGAFGPAILTLCLGLALALGGCQGGEGPREAPGVSVAAPSDGVPAWELVYDLEVDGNADLWAVSASVAEPRRVTSSPGYDGMARFTPDGERIVFSSERDGRLAALRDRDRWGRGTANPHQRRDGVSGRPLGGRPEAGLPDGPRRAGAPGDHGLRNGSAA